MEKVSVFYTKEVQDYLDDLISILFFEEYFSFQENAIEYAEKLVYFINNNIENIPHKKIPRKTKKIWFILHFL